MKNLFYILLLSCLLMSCQKEKSLLQTNKTHEISLVESNTSEIYSIHQLMNSTAGDLVPIPADYQLKRSWSYTNAYLFTNNTGETHEIYTFTENSPEIISARQSCDKVYSTKTNKNGTTTTTCDMFGNTCSITITDECGSVCISVCTTE